MITSQATENSPDFRNRMISLGLLMACFSGCYYQSGANMDEGDTMTDQQEIMETT